MIAPLALPSGYSTQWIVVQSDNRLHVIPTYDAKIHHFLQPCWCQPQLLTQARIVIVHTPSQ